MWTENVDYRRFWELIGEDGRAMTISVDQIASIKVDADDNCTISLTNGEKHRVTQTYSEVKDALLGVGDDRFKLQVTPFGKKEEKDDDEKATD
jgi:hypothetical protein